MSLTHLKKILPNDCEIHFFSNPNSKYRNLILPTNPEGTLWIKQNLINLRSYYDNACGEEMENLEEKKFDNKLFHTKDIGYGVLSFIKKGKKTNNIGKFYLRKYQETKDIYIDSICSDNKNYNKSGIGTIMMNEIKFFALLNGFYSIHLDSIPQAIPFYEKMGFEKLGGTKKFPHMVFYLRSKDVNDTPVKPSSHNSSRRSSHNSSRRSSHNSSRRSSHNSSRRSSRSVKNKSSTEGHKIMEP